MNKLTVLENLRACSEAAKKFAGELVATLAQTVTDAITEIENHKADKLSAVAVTIPTTGWSSDSNSTYPEYYDISVAEVTEKDRADIIIAPASLYTAKYCGLCPTNETLAGKIRIRSSSVPSSPISVQYWLEKGKE